MGVLGLSSFIWEQKPKLLRHHRLHSDSLVVDAYNLCHYLYYNFHLQVQYNGQYEQYARHLRAFLQTLIDCKINLIMIFDGAYNEDDRKLETTVKRFKNRLSTAVSISRGRNGGVLPILARQVFVEVLKELEIVHLTCDFEADSDMASVANYYQCPVLSNDSDFYIFNLSHGFVPLDYLDITKHTETDTGANYINVKLYKLEYLMDDFLCKDYRLAGLWATIIGNDFIGSNQFVDFYSMLNLPASRVKYRVGKSTVSVPRRHDRIGRMLSWLQRSNSFETSLHRLLTVAKADGHNDLEECVMKNINMYSVEETGLVQYLKSDAITAENSPLFDRVPLSLLRRFRCCQVDPDVFNTFLTKRVWLLPQIEDFKAASSYRCARGLRQIVYGLMNEMMSVDEYDRDEQKRCVVKISTEPETKLSDSRVVPNLDELITMSENEKLEILSTALECQENLLINASGRHFLAAICSFWMRNCEPMPTPNVLYALLLSYVKTEILINLRNENRRNSSNTETKIPETILKPIAQKFAQIKSRNNFCAEQSAKILHSLAQFLACFLATSQILQILDVTMGVSPRFYDGLLIHNLCMELEKRSQPQVYIMGILGGKTGDLWLAFEQMMTDIINGDQQILRAINDASISTKKKKKKKTRKIKGKDEKNIVDSQEEMEETDSRVLVNCDLANKFDFLTLSSE